MQNTFFLQLFIGKILKHSMIARKPLGTRSRKCGDLYEFKSRQTFYEDVLPTTRDILKRLFYEPSWRQKTAATTVAEELV